MFLEKLLLVEDEAILRESLVQQLRNRFEVAAVDTLAEALLRLNTESFDLVITDVKLPDGQGLDILEQLPAQSARPLVIVISAFGSPESAVESLNLGAFAYLFKPFSRDQLEAVLAKAEAHARLLRVNHFLSRQAAAESSLGLVGTSAPMEQLRQAIRQIARTDASVLIHGESGVGKTLVARALYEQSARAARPCLKVDATAIPEALLETELFGCETSLNAGAATRRQGGCELANGGTLLLEEVGLLPLSVQARLLRLLQTQAIERVGGHKPVPVDVRLIATTSRDLEAMVQRKEFREDLYLALQIVPLRVPPLRERAEDLPALAEHFRQYYSRRHGISVGGFSPDCLAMLCQYAWPGNVRELQQVIERAVLQGVPGALLESCHVGIATVGAAKAPAQEELLSEAERKHIFDVLERCEGNRTHAARRLGISLRTLRNKLREYRDSETVV